MTTLVAGDFMPGGMVLPAANNPIVFGPHLQSMVRRADHFIVNLECPFRDGEVAPNPDKTLLYAHESVVEQMRRLGITAANLANNHLLDYGPAAMERTVTALADAGILSFGAGRNLAEAAAPLILSQPQGPDIVHLAFGWVPPTMKEGSAAATDQQPGINPLWPDYVREQIASRRERGEVWVHLHWGEEYTRLPAPALVAQARSFVAAGAALLVGHHPHIVQGMMLNNHPRFFSLGNFMFAPRYSADGGRSQCAPEDGRLMTWPRHLYVGQVVSVQSTGAGVRCEVHYVKSGVHTAAVEILQAGGLHRYLVFLGWFYHTWCYRLLHGVLSMIERSVFGLRKLAWEARDHGLRSMIRKIAIKANTRLFS